jgi:Cell Wall Hydrolase
MANEYDFDASGYPFWQPGALPQIAPQSLYGNGPWNAWSTPAADAYGWPELAGIPIEEQRLNEAVTRTAANLYNQNFRPHTAKGTFNVLDGLMSAAPAGGPQVFTMADVEAARRSLSEIGAGQGPDAAAAAIAHRKLGDFMTSLASTNALAGDPATAQAQGVMTAPRGADRELMRPTAITPEPGPGFRQDFPAALVPTQGFAPPAASAPPRPLDPWSYLVPPRGPLPTWEIAPPAAPAPTPPLRFDDMFPPSETMTPRSIDPSRYRVPPPYAPQATWPDTVPPAGPSQALSFDERFGVLPWPQQPDPNKWLPPLRPRDWPTPPEVRDAPQFRTPPSPPSADWRLPPRPRYRSARDVPRELKTPPEPLSYVPLPTWQGPSKPPRDFMLAPGPIPSDWVNPMDAQNFTADVIVTALARQLRTDPEHIDKAVRTIYGEAAGGTPRERQAVGSVILNRSLGKPWMTLTEIVQEKGRDRRGRIVWQFEPWAPKRRQELESLDTNSQAYLDAARALLAASQADPTRGATHFWAPKAQSWLGRKPPEWADGTGGWIGDTVFLGPQAPYLPRRR